MLLSSLYEVQEKVDQAIQENLQINIHDTVHVDLRVIAWKVELGEFYNEVGFFKYWKQSHQMDKTKTLEELADCMAFVLSVGLSRKYSKFVPELKWSQWKKVPLEQLASYLFNNDLASSGRWKDAFEQLICIGYKLGFTIGQMEVAYYMKSNENLDRQRRGY